MKRASEECPGTAIAMRSSATSFRESRPGDVLVVEVEPKVAEAESPARVTPHHVGTWSFTDVQREVASAADLDALDSFLSGLPDKDRTIVRYALRGTLTVAQHARLEALLERHRDTLAALYAWSRHHDVAVVSDQEEWSELGLGGFLGTAVEEIRSLAETAAAQDAPAHDLLASLDDDRQVPDAVAGTDDDEDRAPEGGSWRPFVPGRDDDEESARDALALLYRLTRGGVA